MRNRPLRRARGFTLIETIITLVVLGIAAAMMVVFFGPGITKRSDPIFALQNDADLQTAMENMIAFAATPGMTLATMKSDFGATGSDQTNDFGMGTFTYHVDRNSYCSLDTGTNTFVDGAGVTDYLCVTISHPSQSGSKLSYLFTAP